MNPTAIAPLAPVVAPTVEALDPWARLAYEAALVVVPVLVSLLLGFAIRLVALYTRTHRHSALAVAARVAVHSAEQLYQTGVLGDGEEKMAHALDYIDAVLPGMRGDVARAAVEAAVHDLPQYLQEFTTLTAEPDNVTDNGSGGASGGDAVSGGLSDLTGSYVAPGNTLTARVP